ncbi:hypothetical protein BC6307_22065 [Sutcliffiella cohnii]|uniref:Metallophosphoesterase n=1 Tax=Sutcliffiella cohnii TaxID=33932 RepID=A0A223KWI4_9BACI|nr:lamin tail domain-containing protein [Sutcliffiella cohnii]AST93764.1 hypothetical protein BC6307_22065 [Sutcliffiella cohnii]
MKKGNVGAGLNKLLVYMLMFLLVFSNISLSLPPKYAFATEVESSTSKSEMSLLLTEIGSNADEAGYEFFEVYNTTANPISLVDFSFVYDNMVDSNIEITIPETTVQPKEVIVFWFNSQSRNLGEFNQYYGVELAGEQVVELRDNFPGFEKGNRALIVKDETGSEVVSAQYKSDDMNDAITSILYKYPEVGPEMEKLSSVETPTPGLVEPEQVEAPSILEQESTEVEEEVSAEPQEESHVTIDNKKEIETVEEESTEEPNVVPMENTPRLPLLITELSPNSAGGGTDYYEFFELYNTTQENILVSDYTFIYDYTNSDSELPFQIPETTIKPGEVLVFWINNGDRSLEEFNENFQINLTSEQVIQFKDVFPGFANGGNRALVIRDIEGKEVVSASYLASDNDNTGAGIQYKYPLTGTMMEKYQSLAPPTPGTVEAVQIEEPKEEPVVEEPIDEQEDTYSDLPILITELSPNSVGGGTDYFEYFELYNNTNQPLSLLNFSFIYLYTQTGNELTFQIPVTTIEPQETLVFWFNVGDRSLDQFNENFGTQLTSEQVVEFKDVFPGFANGGDRALVLKDKDGNVVVSASYLGSDNDNTGAGIEYKFPQSGTEMEKYKSLAPPTPGTIEPIQVPTKRIELEELPVDIEAPVISHEPVTEATAFSPVQIEAEITDNETTPFANVFYKLAEGDDWKSIPMRSSEDNSQIYRADIPGLDVQGDVIYYIEATDGFNIAKTEEYTISVQVSEVDYNSLPHFLVTEIVPDSTNVGTADGYEFIEIYNNTNKDINFKDYKINYRYGADPNTDVVWPSIPEEVMIPSKGTLVFWIINDQNGHSTVDDFNANYGSDLVENKDIVRIYSAGMANAAMRGLLVATNAKKPISIAYYNDEPGVDDTHPDQGILYKYPQDGTIQSTKLSIEAATPGRVESFQVPPQVVELEDDTTPPIVTDLTSVTEVLETEDILIRAEASDDREVKSVRLFYSLSTDNDYRGVILNKNQENETFFWTIASPDIIGEDYVDYYFVVSDGTNELVSETKRITVSSLYDKSSLRLNVSDGEVIAGKKVIKGTSPSAVSGDVKLYIDEEEWTEGLYSSLEQDAYFAYEVSGINALFQNAVTMGDDILHIFDRTMADWTLITIPIEADRLTVGENTITVRSGNKSSPFELDQLEENRDDFNLRDVRLVLPDGTILRDPLKSDPTQVFDMGDDGTYRPFEHFTFTITEEQAPSQSFIFDTTTVLDGEYTIKALDVKQNETMAATVFVDNTAPQVSTSIMEGHEYKGPFTIEVQATDNIAGVSTVRVLLNGKEIETPYETASSLLSPGEHKLVVIATDNVGNRAEETVHFSVVNENPFKPELVSPTDSADHSVDGDPTLVVKVSDPTDDELKVSFYEGFKYDAKRTDSIRIFSNATDYEPPQTMVPEGEEKFGDEEYVTISEKDGNYVTNDSSTQFPYHRFEVTIDETIDENDLIELVWNGNSLDVRKVSMYAWNHDTKKWELLDYKIAGIEDFELKGIVSFHEYVKEQKVNVLVQDEIPSSPEEYDYTFVWMTDTQYYSESYPHIYDGMTHWIAENKDELKIKYVFHSGDLVDKYYQEFQWVNADRAMKTLDDHNIPYGVIAGNHDVDYINDDYTEYYKWFGEERFKNKPYYGGSYKNNRGHFDLISEKGNDFIMVHMGWGVSDEDIEWMNDVLAQYPDRIAILNFHEYLLVSGNRSPIGNRIFNEVVVPNKNVVAVLSGHYHDAQTLVSEVDDNGDGVTDRKVYQMLADYQGGPEGGLGYMRLLHIDQDNNRIIVNTYSPYLDKYNYYDPTDYPEKDEFIIEVDLTVKEKRVATDYFAVNVYTDTEIGTVDGVESGSQTEMNWLNLEQNKTYSWYVVAEDQYTGRAVSDIWTFTKGNIHSELPKPTDPVEEDPVGEQPVVENPKEENINTEKGQKTDNSKQSNEKEITKQPETNSGNQSNLLPKTATHFYNWIAIGLILIMASLVIVYKNRRKIL